MIEIVQPVKLGGGCDMMANMRVIRSFENLTNEELLALIGEDEEGSIEGDPALSSSLGRCRVLGLIARISGFVGARRQDGVDALVQPDGVADDLGRKAPSVSSPSLTELITVTTSSVGLPALDSTVFQPTFQCAKDIPGFILGLTWHTAGAEVAHGCINFKGIKAGSDLLSSLGAQAGALASTNVAVRRRFWATRQLPDAFPAKS